MDSVTRQRDRATPSLSIGDDDRDGRAGVMRPWAGVLGGPAMLDKTLNLVATRVGTGFAGRRRNGRRARCNGRRAGQLFL
jgi:hypothetical protein